MSIKLMSLVWDSQYARQSPSRLLVMLKLADHASDDGDCHPSQKLIAEKCGLSRETVNRIVHQLETEGLLSAVRSRTYNRYKLHFDNLPQMCSQVTSEPVEVCADVTSEEIQMCADVTLDVTSRHTRCDVTSHKPSRTISEPSVRTKTLSADANVVTGILDPIADKKTVPDHKLMMEHHGNRIGKILDGAAQGAAVKKLLNNYPLGDCLKCYDHLVSQLKTKGGWRNGKISWLTVIAEIGEWKASQRPSLTYTPLDFDLPTVRIGGIVEDMPSSQTH